MIKRIITICLVILWIFVIFYFSNSDSILSYNQTQLVFRKLISFGFRIVRKLGLTSRNLGNPAISHIASKYHILFRKICHVTVYLIFAFLLNAMLKNNSKYKQTTQALFTILACFIVSLVDEHHQSNVSGRIGAFTDCLIDTSGATLGVILYFLYHKFKNWIKKKFKKTE